MVEAIIIGMGLIVFILVIVVIASGVPFPNTTSAQHLPDGTEYVDKNAQIPHYDGSLADKVDTRFTNIVKNPWEDIL